MFQGTLVSSTLTFSFCSKMLKIYIQRHLLSPCNTSTCEETQLVSSDFRHLPRQQVLFSLPSLWHERDHCLRFHTALAILKIRMDFLWRLIVTCHSEGDVRFPCSPFFISILISLLFFAPLPFIIICFPCFDGFDQGFSLGKIYFQQKLKGDQEIFLSILSVFDAVIHCLF